MEQFDKLGNGYNKTRKIKPSAILTFIVALVTFLSCFPAIFLTSFSSDQSAEAQTKSRGEIVLEAESGRILWGENVGVRCEPASTTKILTAICVLENTDVNREIVIPKEATAVEGSSIYLKVGEKWKTIDLLYGLMLRSGNDSAVALASIFGGIERFALLMNMTALKCGAYNSNFVNPHGLHDPNHYTTAYDLAKITAYAYRNQTFREIVSTKAYYYDYSGERRCFVNKNKMLRTFDGANGVKTGYTRDSGRCLVFGAERDGMQLVSVVLNEPNMWQKTATIVEKAFGEYKMQKVLSRNDVKEVTVNGEKIGVRVNKDLFYPLKDGEKELIDVSYVTLSQARSVKSGTEIGKVSVSIANHLIFNEKLYTI